MCSDATRPASAAGVAIDVRGVGKTFRLYKRPQDRLLQHFTRRTLYREFRALEDISFQVRRGETIGIIGRNGSGKSTLLQMICGTLTPTQGEIAVHGRIAALLELGAGFNPEFTGRENVYLNASILGLSQAQIDARLDDIFAFADIGEFVDQPVKTYSSGMYVRLAFAVIAHVDADILVIDEALAVGDALFTQKCMRFLRKFRETGTILFVSHDSQAVTNLCQRAVWLAEGRIRQQGSAKEVCESYLAWLFGSQNQSRGAPAARPRAAESEQWLDARQAFINASNLRNDLQVFRFDPHQPAFGQGGAVIDEVFLASPDGQRMAWVVGGELTDLVVRVRVREPLDRPIVGFYVKDRLGQTLFGDNTYLSYADDPVAATVDQCLTARFRFPMPLLPAGDYSIAVAVADGTQEEHVQHHWIHDALLFRSQCSAVSAGLVGIPMLDIRLEAR
ncbi:ABC transporter ATP-binding protein [Castellaniella defragrans]|uniref:Lipopolysaccharide transport system ATP-binding protein n=1 Tax=Castellaniella defragrans TaxID=75697 RepID=A0A7W9WMA2_CASDE|nr:ABC transporter ATP-binding protein [Castellaniella defragrans]KAB0597436.1 ABC transporter ATP-binding protein [Castellaniella defragrans]MBB6084097.1 lipopolysaccharide transport system ATP-binding protein [Castellaniella defragrans]